ncbi:MAG: hypothetical protein CL581_09520 [Alteromonadaceae bacterium]|jgi:hypothetical protein|nr:hypothetical protein [Alteromonadaceae bacterium]
MSIAPTFSIYYNQGYAARPTNYDWLYSEAFKQIERLNFFRDWEDPAEIPRFVERTLSDNFTPKNRATDNLLQSALGFEPTEHSDAPPYITPHPFDRLAEAHAKHNIQPCVDFGFEPTDGEGQ